MLEIVKVNRLALLIDEERRHPGAIARNGEQLRKACREYYDDGSFRSVRKIRKKRRR